MDYFFETQCHKCGCVDEAKFCYAGPHIKQICGECGAYIKFFDKKLIPDVKEIKLKIWDLAAGNLELIEELKEELGFMNVFSGGVEEKMIYWRLYRRVREKLNRIP